MNELSSGDVSVTYIKAYLQCVNLPDTFLKSPWGICCCYQLDLRSLIILHLEFDGVFYAGGQPRL